MRGVTQDEAMPEALFRAIYDALNDWTGGEYQPNHADAENLLETLRDAGYVVVPADGKGH